MRAKVWGAEAPLRRHVRRGASKLTARKVRKSVAIGTSLLVGIIVAACVRSEPPNASAPQPQQSTRSTVDPKTGTSASPRLYTQATPIPKGGGSYKVGVPYQVSGRWYHPREEPGYDRTGVASWYGDDFHGRKTANGEIYDMNALSAAHTTLPMPSYVWVTNLENGRSLLVRVNDRGPYAHDRAIDLSRAAARALGSEGRGLSQVRVRFAGPAPLNGDDRREQAFLRSQPWFNFAQSPAPAQRQMPYMRPYAEADSVTGAAKMRPAMAAGLGSIVTATEAKAQPLNAEQLDRPNVERADRASGAVTTDRHVIAGSFRNEANAERRATELERFATMRVVPITTAIGTIYQVRSDPMSDASAQRTAEEIVAAGIKDVRVTAGRTPAQQTSR